MADDLVMRRKPGHDVIQTTSQAGMSAGLSAAWPGEARAIPVGRRALARLSWGKVSRQSPKIYMLA